MTQPSSTEAADPSLYPETAYPTAVVDHHRAFESFVAPDETRLSFVEGDVLSVLKKDTSGWWLCQLNGACGWAPASFLEPLPSEPQDSSKLYDRLQRT